MLGDKSRGWERRRGDKILTFPFSFFVLKFRLLKSASPTKHRTRTDVTATQWPPSVSRCGDVISAQATAYRSLCGSLSQSGAWEDRAGEQEVQRSEEEEEEEEEGGESHRVCLFLTVQIRDRVVNFQPITGRDREG